MFTMKTPRASGSNRRLLIFRIVAVIIALLFVAVAGSEFIPAWIMGNPAMSIHLWHIAELLALLGILLGGTLLALLHRPQGQPLLAQFFVLSMIISSIALMPFEIKAGALLIIMVLFSAAFPRFRTLLRFPRQGPISYPLLALSLLLAWMLAPIAYREIQWQIIGMVTGDVHALELHWIGSALLMGLLVLAGILTATRVYGWKELGIITGVTYCYLGVTGMMLQASYPGSWSGGYGLIAIIAGFWYIIGSFAGAQLLREADIAHKQPLASIRKDVAVQLSARDKDLVMEKVGEVGAVPKWTRTAPLPETQKLLGAV